MKIGDIVKWNDGVHGPSSGEVVLLEADGTDKTLVAMDTLSDAKPVVAIDSAKFITEDVEAVQKPAPKKSGK